MQSALPTHWSWRRHRKQIVTAAVVFAFDYLLGCNIADGRSVAGATHVDPVQMDGNPDCVDLGFDFGFKPQPEPPPSGTYPFPDGIHELELVTDGTFVDWTSTLSLDAVIVKGGNEGANVYYYSPEETSDTGLHTPTQQAISHIEVCYDYELDVEKDAETEFTRTYDWDITKSVNPASWELFVGESGTSKYTVVVNKDDGTDSDWAVSGTISIENNTPFDATVTDVSDVISVGINAVVVCPNGLPDVIPAGGSLDCTYSSALPDASDRLNTATVETEGLVGGGEATADVDFSTATINKVNDEVDVEDVFEGGDAEPLDTISDDDTFIYFRTFECGVDHLYENIASVIGDDDEVLDSDDASVDVDCYELDIDKDAVAQTITEEYGWEIEKGDDATYHLFNGDSQEHKYTIELIRSDAPQSETVTIVGEITISNPHPTRDADINSVSDVISGGGPDVDADVECPSMVVPAGGNLVCDYSATVDSSAYDINTATAVQQLYDFDSDGNETADGTASHTVIKGIDYSNVVIEVVPVDVVDDNATPGDGSDDPDFGGPFTTSQTLMYTNTFACDADAGDNTNTASVVDEDGNPVPDPEGDPLKDTATVTLVCYELTVTKDADTSFTRKWDWTIDKSADQSVIGPLAPGQLFAVKYEVTVDATSTDSNWAVAGTITIANPAPIPAEITNVLDVVSVGINAAVVCPDGLSFTIPANGSVDCTYSADLPNADDRTNTATATLQNYDYDVEGNGTPSGTTDFSGSADVIFGDPTTEIDECVDVEDTNVGFLGTVCADQAPDTFNYILQFGDHPDADVLLVCGENTHVNTAKFTTNDTGTMDSSSWTVIATLECIEGCTLTPGYWQTHSEYGPAPYDDTWAMLSDGADTLFFLSGQSYYEVLWTAPKGNAYYNLSFHYIAAELNMLNDADAPADVQDAFDQATALFETYTPNVVGGWKGQQGERATFIALAQILADYNEGVIGPGHCDEDGR